MDAQAGFVIDYTKIWVSITLEGPYWHGVIFPIHLFSSSYIPVLIIIMCKNILYHNLHWVQPGRLTDSFLEGVGVIPCLYVGCQGVSEVGKVVWRGPGSLFMVEHIVWKIAVSGSMYLVADMDTDLKRVIRPNTLVLPPTFLSLSWNCLLCLSLEVWSLSYYGIRRD